MTSLLSLEDVVLSTTLRSATICNKVSQGEFPKLVQITGTYRIAWGFEDVHAWIEALPPVDWQSIITADGGAV